MPIPTSRADLVDSIHSSWGKLRQDLDSAGPRLGSCPCVDDWSVKDLLAVRAWWTASVVDWIDAGRRGEVPTTPEKGYRWSETPRLNDEIVRRSRRESFRSVRARLEAGIERALSVIDSLTDEELLSAGEFEWAGKYPIARWLSINTTRQYTTARTYVRRAMQNRAQANGV